MSLFKATHTVWYKTYIVEGPRYSSPFIVHHWTSHNFPSSLEKHHCRQLLSQRRSANPVPVQKSLGESIPVLKKYIIVNNTKRRQSGENDWRLWNLSVASDVHLPKPESSTVVPAECRGGCTRHWRYTSKSLDQTSKACMFLESIWFGVFSSNETQL